MERRDAMSDGPDLLNPQVVDAVDKSTGFVFTPNAGAAIAYQQAAHAAALAVQDAVDYQRNALSICAAAQGKALAMMAEDSKQIEIWAQIYALALAGSVAASATAGLISEQASKILANFPRA
jgi:hypothetical protein